MPKHSVEQQGGAGMDPTVKSASAQRTAANLPKWLCAGHDGEVQESGSAICAVFDFLNNPIAEGDLWAVFRWRHRKLNCAPVAAVGKSDKPPSSARSLTTSARRPITIPTS
jgi:hypothetical protein